MMFKIILTALALTAASAVIAQTDSFETKNVVLKEILIHGGYGENGAGHHLRGNVQKSTGKLLESVSGVSLIKRGNFAPEPMIRGFSAGQISLTIDGMAMFGACTDRMDPISSYIEPNNLQSIEINTGGNEENNGNSIAGGFNFKLKQPRINAVKTWSGMTGIGYSTNGNALQTLASVNYSTEKLGVLASGIFRKSGNYSAGGNSKIPFSQYTKWNGSLGVKYKLQEKSFLLLNYLQDEGYDIGYPALTMDVKFAKAKIASAGYLYHSNTTSLRHFDTKVYWNSINHAMDDTKRPAEEVFMHMDMPGTSHTTGTLTNAKWVVGNHEIKAKISLYQNRLRAEMTMYPNEGAPMFMLTLPDAQRRLAEVQLSDKIQFGGNFTLTTGAGVNSISSEIYSTEGRKMVAGIFGEDVKRRDQLVNAFVQPWLEWNENWATFANVAFSSRSATLQELYGFYLFNRTDGFDYLGNPHLKAENSLSFSAGTKYRKGKIKADGELFYYGIYNYITGLKRAGFSVMTHGAKGVKQYSNLSMAHLSGFEVNVNYEILPGFAFASRNSFTYGIDADGDALPAVPPFKSVDELKYHLNLLQIGVEGVFATAQKQVSFEKYGETGTPSFVILNLNAGRDFTWNGKKMSLSVAVENVLDSKYFEHSDIMKVPRMGRNLIFQCSMSF